MLRITPVYTKSQWRHNWKSAQVVNSHLVCDPTIRQPGFDLLGNGNSGLCWTVFCTEQGHCGACRRKWRLTDTDLCPCGETQTMSHIVESCPRTKLNGGLSRLHCGWRLCFVTHHCYGSWHAYEKKEITPLKQQMSLIQVFALNNVSNPPNFRSRWNGRSLNTKLATKNHNTRITTANRNKMVSPHQPGIGKHYQTKFNNKRSVSIPAWSNRDRTAKETIEKCVN